jgi:hypothetical protein
MDEKAFVEKVTSDLRYAAWKRRHNAPTSKLLEPGGLWKSNTRISCARESLTFIVLTHLLFVDRILQVHNASYRKTLYEPRC